MHVNCFSGLLAQATGQSGSQSGQVQNPLTGLVLPIVAMGVMFYFLIIRPGQQRSKQQAKMLAALKSGDKVVTAAGILATVITVKDKSVTLRSGDSKFEVTKASVTDIISEDATTASNS